MGRRAGELAVYAACTKFCRRAQWIDDLLVRVATNMGHAAGLLVLVACWAGLGGFIGLSQVCCVPQIILMLLLVC